MSIHRFAAPALLALGLLAACASHMPPLRADGTAVILGSKTDGMSGPDAMRTVLTAGARVTVDHGGRYFRIVGMGSPYGTNLSVRPGANVAIRVYRQGEIEPHAPGVWDAQQILTRGPPASATAANAVVSPSQRTYAPAAPGKLTPHCNALGCEW